MYGGRIQLLLGNCKYPKTTGSFLNRIQTVGDKKRLNGISTDEQVDSPVGPSNVPLRPVPIGLRVLASTFLCRKAKALHQRQAKLLHAMKKYLTSIALVLALGTVASCKDERDIWPLNREPQFVDKTWEIVAWDLTAPLDIDDDGRVETDLTDLLERCDEDNLMTFSGDGRFLESPGDELCEDDILVEKHTYNWSYERSTQKLTLKNPQTGKREDEWEVLFQSDDRLWIKFNLLPDGKKDSLLKSIIKLKKH